jgi:hypothetical protein
MLTWGLRRSNFAFAIVSSVSRKVKVQVKVEE